jgi:hypothetical protein
MTVKKTGVTFYAGDNPEHRALKAAMDVLHEQYMIAIKAKSEYESRVESEWWKTAQPGDSLHWAWGHLMVRA